MRIRHRETGEVIDDVMKAGSIPADWFIQRNSRRTYFWKHDGWEPVKEKKWVDVTGECEIDHSGYIKHYDRFTMPSNGYKRKMIYVMDEDGNKRGPVIIIEKLIEVDHESE